MTEEVLINSQPYITYVSVAQADLYLQANFLADAWRDLTEDQKGQLIVTVTRLFDRQCWLGEKTLPGQPLAWPRTGIADVDDYDIPEAVRNAAIEMALAIVDGSEAITNAQPGSQKLRSLGAGSVNLAWFRGAEGPQARFDRFPLPVMELIGQWLCSGQQVVGGLLTSGTGGISVTDDDLGYNEGV